jgi:hypothetical protein
MTRRTLLLLVLVVVAGGALLLVTRSGGGLLASSSSATSTPTPAPTPHRGTHVRGTPVKPSPTPIPAPLLHERQYAARLYPIVNHATLVFDRAVRGASGGNLSAVAKSCGHYVQLVGVQLNQVDGVGHPYTWYSPAGLIHRNVLGIYHDMIGAAENCSTTAGNGDQSGTAQARSDMRNADSRLHQMAGRLYQLARQPH